MGEYLVSKEEDKSLKHILGSIYAPLDLYLFLIN